MGKVGEILGGNAEPFGRDACEVLVSLGNGTAGEYVVGE
jgi:hypothetical protein